MKLIIERGLNTAMNINNMGLNKVCSIPDFRHVGRVVTTAKQTHRMNYETNLL